MTFFGLTKYGLRNDLRFHLKEPKNSPISDFDSGDYKKKGCMSVDFVLLDRIREEEKKPRTSFLYFIEKKKRHYPIYGEFRKSPTISNRAYEWSKWVTEKDKQWVKPKPLYSNKK